MRTRGLMDGLVVALQIHAGVERRDLVAVAVEHERLAASQLADTPLVGLAPARMAHFWIHVGVEAVLVGRGPVPRGLGLVLGEADAHDGLAALEAVLPRHHHPERRAVL